MGRETLDKRLVEIDPSKIIASRGINFTEPLSVEVEFVQDGLTYSVYVDGRHDTTRFEKDKVQERYNDLLTLFNEGKFEIHMDYRVSFNGFK